jgi:hypothetical protein
MPRSVAVLMDPISTIKVVKDTTGAGIASTTWNKATSPCVTAPHGRGCDP